MTPDIAALVERLRANADPRCYYHSRILASEAADALTRLSAEVERVKAALRNLTSAAGEVSDFLGEEDWTRTQATLDAYVVAARAALAPASSEGEW